MAEYWDVPRDTAKSVLLEQAAFQSSSRALFVSSFFNPCTAHDRSDSSSPYICSTSTGRATSERASPMSSSSQHRSP